MPHGRLKHLMAYTLCFNWLCMICRLGQVPGRLPRRHCLARRPNISECHHPGLPDQHWSNTWQPASIGNLAGHGHWAAITNCWHPKYWSAGVERAFSGDVRLVQLQSAVLGQFQEVQHLRPSACARAAAVSGHGARIFD